MAFDKVIDSQKLDNKLKSIANKIRQKAKTSKNLNFFTTDFENAIDSIPEPKPEQAKSKTINSNQTTTILPDIGKVLNKVTVTVNVPSSGGAMKPEVMGNETITENKTQTFYPPLGKVFSSFSVTVNTPTPKAEQKKEITITQNNITKEITPDNGKALNLVSVKTAIPEQTRTVDITSNGSVELIPDPGKLFNKIIANVNVPSSGEGSSSIQMASGTMSNYQNGVMNITGLSFKPVIVVVAFNENSNKKKRSTFFTAAIDDSSLLNTSQGLEEFKSSFTNYVYGTTVKNNATFKADGVSFTPITDNSGTITNVKWWAFGGFTI